MKEDSQAAAKVTAPIMVMMSSFEVSAEIFTGKPYLAAKSGSEGAEVASSNNFLTSCPGLNGTHFDTSLSLEARLDYMFSTPWSTEEFVGQMTENATFISRLSVPAYNWLNDDQHGVKQPDATAFPNGASLGATWDTALLHSVGLAIGYEARGVHNTLGDKSGETGGHSWPGTLRNGVGLTLYAPNVNLVHE